MKTFVPEKKSCLKESDVQWRACSTRWCCKELLDSKQWSEKSSWLQDSKKWRWGDSSLWIYYDEWLQPPSHSTVIKSLTTSWTKPKPNILTKAKTLQTFYFLFVTLPSSLSCSSSNQFFPKYSNWSRNQTPWIFLSHGWALEGAVFSDYFQSACSVLYYSCGRTHAHDSFGPCFHAASSL